MIRKLTLFVGFAVVFSRGAYAEPRPSQATRSDPSSKATQATDLLKGIAKIPEFAAALEALLRDQGASIDRRKAIRTILPIVGDIQRRLSDLEDQNKTLVRELEPTPFDRERVKSTLVTIAGTLSSMRRSISNIRSSIQPLSIKEITDLERVAEEAFDARGQKVDDMLKQLGYLKQGASGLEPAHLRLKEASQNLTSLLHKAQDAFSKLHDNLRRQS